MACTAGGQVVRRLRPRQVAARVHSPNTGIGPISRIDDNNGKTPVQQAPWRLATARSSRSARPCDAAAEPAPSRSGRPRSRLATGGIAQVANEPGHRGLVMRNPVEVRAVTIWGQDRHREGVLVDVQAKVGGARCEPLAMAGSFRMWLRARHVDDPRTCYLRNGAGRSMLINAWRSRGSGRSRWRSRSRTRAASASGAWSPRPDGRPCPVGGVG
jgi:hypothetical protein